MPNVAVLRVSTVWVIAASFGSPEDCDYVFINLGARNFDEYKEMVSALPLTGQKLSSFLSITFCDTIDAVSANTLESVIGEHKMQEVEAADESSILVLSHQQIGILENEAEGTRGGELHVYQDAFYWTFFPRHTHVECVTRRLAFEEV